MKKPIAKTKRPSKLELLTIETFQRNSHDATIDIARKRTVLDCELASVEDQIIMMNSRVADAKRRKSEIEAEISGLTMVIAKR